MNKFYLAHVCGFEIVQNLNFFSFQKTLYIFNLTQDLARFFCLLMVKSPKKNNSSFDEEKLASQQKDQFKNLYSNKSEVQIGKMVQKPVNKEKKTIESTNKPSTQKRFQNGTNNKQESGSKQTPSKDKDADPKKRLFKSQEKEIYVIVPKENMQNHEPMPDKKDLQLPGDQSSTGSPIQKKVKKIKKNIYLSRMIPKEYYNFCTYYRQKLKAQHPKWASHQIATIVKLLWRKKKTSERKLATHLIKIKPKRNPLTGRKYFGDMKRKEQNMEADEIKERWYELPKESRKYLTRLGKGGNGFSIPLKTMSKTIKLGYLREVKPSYLNNNVLSFINQS